MIAVSYGLYCLGLLGSQTNLQCAVNNFSHALVSLLLCDQNSIYLNFFFLGYVNQVTTYLPILNLAFLNLLEDTELVPEPSL